MSWIERSIFIGSLESENKFTEWDVSADLRRSADTYSWGVSLPQTIKPGRKIFDCPYFSHNNSILIHSGLSKHMYINRGSLEVALRSTKPPWILKSLK